MNKYDSELIAGILSDHGFRETLDRDDADTVIINTCSVRDHAEKRVRGRIGVMSGWKKSKPHGKLIIVGCMAQRLGDTLASIPHVDGVVGPDQYRKLPDLIKSGHAAVCSEISQTHTENYSRIKPKRLPGVSGWVAISRGCNNFCTYCIVPYVRGRERSRPMTEIIDEVQDMVLNGFQEVTLLGQNVNSYRDGERDFPRLLETVARETAIRRIRFMTSHPKDLSQRLLEVMASYKTICPHIHLPFQAGSNRVLEKMNRGYTREHYLNLVGMIRKWIPIASLTTDIMVGFPGESEADFEETAALVQQVRFDDAFTYQYSPRPGTRAADMDGQIPEKERLRRLNILIEQQRRISLEKRKAMIGQVVEVLPEAHSKQSVHEWMGRTPTDHVVVFPKQRLEQASPVRVRIEECRGATLRGIPLVPAVA